MRHCLILKILGLCLLLAFAGGCEVEPPVRQEGAPRPVQSDEPPRSFLNESMPLKRVELAGEALAVWRRHSQQKPTLLLLSNDPMLVPVPEELRPDVARLIASASQSEIAERGTLRRADPLLLPVMTVDAALRSDWFGQLIWGLPIRDTETELSAERIREQLRQTGVATEAELASVAVADKRVSGIVRATPFVAAALPNLPEVSGPVIVHFDQSYFQQLYKNEIKTPIFPLIYQTLQQLRARKVQVLAATFAEGNVEGRIALDVRFVGEVVQALVENPQLFDQPVAAVWKQQSDILYLANFFQEKNRLEMARAMVNAAPEQAWPRFTLYRVAAANKLGSEALEALAAAVAIDHIYALEYLALADLAYSKRRPDEALRMLKLASDAFPEDPLVALQLVRLTTDLGDHTTALHLMKPLAALSWSTVYYPEMPEFLAAFAARLEAGPDSANGTSSGEKGDQAAETR